MRTAATGPVPAALALLLAGVPARAEPEERPFPVGRTTILRAGRVVYVVEGTITIAEGVDISLQKDVHVVGRGESPTLRVEGTLKVHGVGLREVIFEGVTVELAPDFRDVQLDMVIFRNGGGIHTSDDKPSAGKLFVENVVLKDSASIDLRFRRGSIDLSSVTCGASTGVAAVEDEAGEVGKLRLNIRGSDLSNLTVRNGHDVTVRLTRLAGAAAEFHDCRTLTIDGNKVNASLLAITHSNPGGLTKTKVTKCDVYSEAVEVRSPLKNGRVGDKVVVDRCWFKGVTDQRALRAEVIRDAEDDPENGARLVLRKVSARPNELAGAVDR